jgi:hypothetical protein
VAGSSGESDIAVRWRVAALAIAAALLARNEVDADLWGHVKYGEALLRTHVLPSVDPYSYTAGTHPWINHEIVAEAVLAWVARFGGGAIVAWKTVLGLATLAIVAHLGSRGTRGRGSWLFVGVPAVVVMALGWAPRPQVLGYFFFAILLMLLETRSLPRIGLALPLFSIWANVHGGFLFGLAIFGLAIAVRLVARVRTGGPGWVREAGLTAALGVGAFVAPMANPYGFGLYRGIVEELGIPRLQIREWGPLSWTVLEFPSMNILVLGVVGVLIGRWRLVSIERRVLLIAMLIQAQLHLRHTVFLAIAAVAWLPGDLEALMPLRWRRLLSDAVGGWRRWGLRAVAAAIAGVALLLLVARLEGIRVHRRAYPVDAFGFISSRGLEGRMVVPFNWGQYVLFAFHPRILVSFDGRYGTVYPAAILDMNFDLWFPPDPELRSRPSRQIAYDPARILEVGRPDLVLVDRRNKQGEAVLASRGDWTLLYQDLLSQIYGRTATYDVPGAPRYLPPEARVRLETPLEGWAWWPGVP